MRSFCFRLFLGTLVLLTSIARAEAPAWQILPNNSAINFTAAHNNAPIFGSFKTFTGDIAFDPAQLSTSKVRIVIDTSSITLSRKEIGDTLKNATWFDVMSFPKAIFVAEDFTQIGDKTYQASGSMTIRDKTIPLTLTFELDDYSLAGFHISGSTILKRSMFGIGTGVWEKTDEVKDDVHVNFTLTAKSIS